MTIKYKYLKTYYLMYELYNIDNYVVEIYGKKFSNDEKNSGYNIGDLLNMPYLGGWWNSNPHHSNELLNRMNIVGENYKGSILSFYVNSRNNQDKVPNVNGIKKSIEKFMIKNMDIFEKIKYSLHSPDTLCVHLRCGDRDVESSYISKIESMSKKFKKVYILSGLHLDENFCNNDMKKNNFMKCMKHILSLNNNISLIIGSPDEHLCCMYLSSNLLLHKGGFSVLGTIASCGNIYVTSSLDHNIGHVNWKNAVNKKYIMV